MIARLGNDWGKSSLERFLGDDGGLVKKLFKSLNGVP